LARGGGLRGFGWGWGDKGNATNVGVGGSIKVKGTKRGEIEVLGGGNKKRKKKECGGYHDGGRLKN